ncbi:MAG: galactose oxidase-like domain-containing protein, partial [Acidobacteriota bacterium]
PNGKVLYVPHRFNPDGRTPSVVFDPDDPAGARYVTVPENYFCGGHTMLSDGRLLFNGGETLPPNDLNGAGYFDYRTETWTVVSPMNRPRWYPSTLQLGDNSIWTFGGQNEAAEVSTNDPTIEVYDVASGQWTPAGGEGIPGQWVEAYNRLHLMPDGKIFQSGHLPETYLYDPVAKTWTFVDTTNLNRARGNGSSVRLQDGRILIVGGEDKILYFNSAEVIDLSQPNPRWQNVASMSGTRAFIDAIVLPDGKVLVVGGDEGVGSALLTPELYDPVADTWTNMAPFTIPRGYHSTTLLLPDGRVILSGGEGNNGPGIFGESPDYEIWSPYYLFRTPRPILSSLPAQAAYGGRVSLSYSSTVPVSHAVIHRSGSQTHSFSYNQISVPVSFDSSGGGAATFTVPDNPNLLPPNFYMVFLMSEDGVPSVARWIQIGAQGSELIFRDDLEAGNTSAWTSTVP